MPHAQTTTELVDYILLAEQVLDDIIATIDRHEIEQDDYTIVLDGVYLRKQLQEALDALAAAHVLL